MSEWRKCTENKENGNVTKDIEYKEENCDF